MGNGTSYGLRRISVVTGAALLCALAVVAGAGTLATAGPAAPSAGTITVDQSDPSCVDTTQVDPYSVVYCRISRAVFDSSSAGDVINVAAGTYTETIDIDGKTLTINGAGEGITIVDGNHVDSNVFNIYSGSVVTITGVTIQNGYSSTGYGAGVDNSYCTVTLIDVTVFDSYAGLGGGGVSALGGLTVLRNTTVLSNTTAGDGGGILIANGGVVIIDDSEIISNTAMSNGGGISNGDVLTMTNSTVSNNRLLNTYSYGGGIYNTGTAKLVGVTIRENEALVTAGSGGGIGMWGGGSTLHVVDSIIVENQALAEGGAVWVENGTVTIQNSAIVSNTSSDTGGGLLAEGTAAVAMSNTTVSNNRARTYGGGIYNNAVMTLTNCTIVSNEADSDKNGSGSAGGYLGYSSSSVGTFVNTIVADNLDNTLSYHDCENTGGAINVSLDHNVVENVGNCTFGGSDDVTGTDPTLGTLADNGGNTWTHALLDGSVAIDGGDDAYCPAHDQRGRTRVPPCDVGSYEISFPVYLPLVLNSH